MKLPRTDPKKARIEIIPLIDVTFLLLVFFIYLSMSMTIQKGIPLRLPQSATAEHDRSEAVEVGVDAEGRVFLDQRPVSLTDLPEALRLRTASSGMDRVILRGDEGASYDRIVAVLDRIRQSGIGKVSLGTGEKETVFED